MSGAPALDPVDRAIVTAMQAGLPLAVRPWAVIGAAVGLPEQAVLDRVTTLRGQGIIRRVAAAPNHYALGMTANGMTVWDVDDAAVDVLGERVGALDFVSHAYRRPRALPDWPYNLFAMVHGASRDEVESKRAVIKALLGAACRGHDILYSTRILKKTGLRLSGAGREG